MLKQSFIQLILFDKERNGIAMKVHLTAQFAKSSRNSVRNATTKEIAKSRISSHGFFDILPFAGNGSSTTAPWPRSPSSCVLHVVFVIAPWPRSPSSCILHDVLVIAPTARRTEAPSLPSVLFHVIHFIFDCVDQIEDDERQEKQNQSKLKTE